MEDLVRHILAQRSRRRFGRAAGTDLFSFVGFEQGCRVGDWEHQHGVGGGCPKGCRRDYDSPHSWDARKGFSMQTASLHLWSNRPCIAYTPALDPEVSVCGKAATCLALSEDSGAHAPRCRLQGQLQYRAIALDGGRGLALGYDVTESARACIYYAR